MPFVAASVSVSNMMSTILCGFAKSKTRPACQVQRAKIILLAAEGMNNQQISTQIGLGQDSVSKWRTRWIKSYPLFSEIEEKSSSNLEQEIAAFLKDLPRPGGPCDFTDEQIIKILEIACRNPSDFGYESSHWSLNQLVSVTIKEGIATSVSAKTISRFLKYGEHSPASRPLLAAFLREGGRP